LNTIFNHVSAILDNSDVDTTGNVNIEAIHDSEIYSATLGLAGSATSQGQAFAGAGSATLSAITSELEALARDSTVNALGTVTLEARDDSSIGSGAGGAAVAIAGGSNGGVGGAVGAALALNTIISSVEATIERSSIGALAPRAWWSTRFPLPRLWR